jgi:hypothetical protein
MDTQEIVDRFAPLNARFDNRERLRQDPPQLAHYTSVQVLEKIILDEELWFSNPLYMNDLEEMRFGLNEGAQLFLSSPVVIEAAGSEHRAQIIRGAFHHYYQMLDMEGALDIYVFCFCEHDRNNDDGILSMWRGYGGHGNGVALVLDTASIPDPPAAPLYISPVQYGSRKTRVQWMNDILKQWADILKDSEIPDDLLYISAHQFFIVLKLLALTTKHDGFKEEREWRIIYQPENDPQQHLGPALSYHIGDRGVEPKLKYRIGALPRFSPSALSLSNLLVRIILGPTVSHHLSILATKRMLDRIGKPEFQDRVAASSIPLRPRGA